MLVNFKIKNFLSFNNLQEYSFISGKSDQFKERVVNLKDFELLKFSALYGANGSGKSNFVKALSMLKKAISLGYFNEQKLYHYKLIDESINQPTYFEIHIMINDKYYSYGIEYLFSKKRIISEWLVEIHPTKKDKVIFERDVVNSEMNFNIQLKGKMKNKFNVYIDDIKSDSEQLFLSWISKLISKKDFFVDDPNSEEALCVLSDIFKWFKNDFNIAKPTSDIASGPPIYIDKKLKKLTELLIDFGIPIDKVELTNVEMTAVENDFPTKFLEILQKRFFEKKDNEFKTLVRGSKKLYIISSSSESSFEKLIFEKVIFRSKFNKNVSFDLSELSDGTIRIFDLADILITDQKNQLFVVDEIDRCLHPNLTRNFIEKFLNNQLSLNNQLIITTHESRLLDLKLLRRDEIWFIEEGRTGSSLYSFEEYKQRNDKKIDKDYLSGRFGAIPMLKD